MTGPSELAILGADVEWTDAVAATAARERIPAGSGRLAELAEWLAATRGSAAPAAPARARALIVGDSAPDTDGPLAEIASQHGVGVRVLTAPAEVTAAFSTGAGLADEEVDGGMDLLVLAGSDSLGAAATVTGVITGAEPVALLPRGAHAVDTYAWIRAATRLRDDRRRIVALRDDPDALLAALGSPALALATALLMRSVARRTPVILDGELAMTAALLCYATQARAGRWWQAADTCEEPVHRLALAELAQTPLLALGVGRSDGVAGVLAVAVLRAASALVAPDRA